MSDQPYYNATGGGQRRELSPTLSNSVDQDTGVASILLILGLPALLLVIVVVVVVSAW